MAAAERAGGGASAAELILASFRRHDAAGDGTVRRGQLLEILGRVGVLPAADAERGLAALGFPGKAEAGAAERIDYAAFVRSIYEPPPPPRDLDDPDTVFDCCDQVDLGVLDEHELRFALNAFGLFPQPKDVRSWLGGRKGVDRAGFKALLRQVQAEAPQAMRQPRAVPYARRGVSLGQLQDLHTTFVESRWIHGRVERFNREHADLIQAGEVHALGPNLYALDRFVIRPVTTPGSGEEGLEEHLRRRAKLPEATHHCSYSELVNPDGVCVDYFVSHWWGHPFCDTMGALSRWAEHSLRRSGRPEPPAVVFWLCFLALNQHRLEDEVGASPEQGPFNAALMRAKGAIMVLDEHVHPFSRIWCLYEVSRLTSLGKDFEIVCSLGPVADLLKGEAGASTRARETVGRIEEALERVSAFGAQASSDDDRFAIWHRIADPLWRRKPLKWLRGTGHFGKLGDCCFKRFDATIRGLLATPLLQASLSAGDSEAVLRAIGLGATFTQRNFDDLNGLRSDICTLEVAVKRGKNVVNWKLLHCAAFFGHCESARCLLASRADLAAATHFGWTPLHLAASNGQASVVELLLQSRAELEAKESTGRTPLQAAAVSGHCEAAEVLLQGGASVSITDRLGETPLHAAAMGGHVDMVELLLAKRARPEAQSWKKGGAKGRTPLHYAAEDNYADVVHKLLCHSELLGIKEAVLAVATHRGYTALDLAQQAGHEEVAELLRPNCCAEPAVPSPGQLLRRASC